MTLVFTYGPDTLQARMYDRVGPSDFLGTAVLEGFQLVFDKPNMKDKDEGLPNLSVADGKATFGLVFDLKPKQIEMLEGFFGGYESRNVRITLIDAEDPDSKIVKSAQTYVARRTKSGLKPSAVSLQATRQGMVENGADEKFVSELASYS